jgi:hypothetical protein
MSKSEQQETQTQGSGKAVQNFSFFCEGDVEPRLNKRIKVLIDSTPNHIVYLDDDFYAEWAYILSEWPKGFDGIANQIGRLETLSTTQLSKTQREPFARLLGEAMARVLGGGKEEEAKEILDKAAAYLNARGVENARRWYLTGAFIIAAVALVASGALIFIRNRIGNSAPRETVEIFIGTLMGSLGAVLSIASRTEAIHLDPVAGPQIHKFEGIVRVAVGMAGAFFVALSIKANLLLGVFQSLPRPFLALVTTCIVAGASERLVPGLIKNMEGSLGREKKKNRPQ